MPSSAGRVAGAALIVVIVSVLAGGRPASAQPVDDAQELAERYAPIVMLRSQAAACDDDGEPFVPMGVDRILDNPQIALRQVGNGDPTVIPRPGGRRPRRPRCRLLPRPPGRRARARVPVRAGQRPVQRRPAVGGLRPCRPGGRPSRRRWPLQYWLYWYYNDWNNKHESDWEFVQLLFPAGSVAEALATEPSSVGYAQHEGGERADWHDDKLQREGTHPVVYSSQRSHASYFSPAVYMGRGASEGFGCDNTEQPSTRVAPEVVVLPDGVDGPRPRWRGSSSKGGGESGTAARTTGRPGRTPSRSGRAPVTWQDEPARLVVRRAGGDTRAAEVIDAFCGGRRVGLHAVHPVRRLPGSHPARPRRPHRRRACSSCGGRRGARSTPTPLRRRRRAGEIWRLAVGEYRRHPARLRDGRPRSPCRSPHWPP